MRTLVVSTRLVVGVLACILAGGAGGGLAAETLVTGVLPAIGQPNTPRAVTVKGAGFAPGASVRLAYGGMEQVATVPVSGWDSAIVDGMAYVSSEVLTVYDVYDPEAPRFVGSCDIPNIGRSIAAAPGFAYVGDTVGNVHVVDVSRPGAPNLVASYASGLNFPVQDVAYAQGHLYANIAWKIFVIDVRDPSTPTLVNTVATPGGFEGLLVKGSVLYACGYQIVLFDITSPELPAEISRLPVNWAPTGIDVSGGYAYIVTDHHLLVADVRDPRAPAMLAARDLEYASRHVAVAHGKAYVGNAHAGLVVYDVRAPGSPVYEGASNIPVLSLGPAGDCLFAFCYGGLLRVLRPAPFPAATLHETHGEATGAAASGAYLYVTDMDMGLLVFERNAPGGGVGHTGHSAYSGFWPTDVAVAAGRAYVAEYNGLRIYDLADPGRPAWIGSFGTGDDIARHVHAAGARAYLATWTAFRVIDASVPEAPRELDAWRPASPANIREMVVTGNRAYLTSGDLAQPQAALQVLGVDAAGSIRQLGALSLPGKGSGGSFCVSGGYAYLADGAEGLRIADVRDPSAMKIVGTLPGNVSRVGCGGTNTVFIALDRDPIRGVVVDVTDPSRPRVAGTIGTPGQIRGFSTAAGRLFVVTNRAGVLELPLLGAVSRVSVGDASTLQATLPGGLPRGSYDVVVRNPDGAGGRLANGFTVLSPGLVAQPRKVSFGDVPLGSARSTRVELYNNSRDTVTLERATVKGGDFSIQPGLSFPLVIRPWRKAGLELRYAPSAAGTALGSVSLMLPQATQPAVRVVLGGTGL